jgi:hypothetical protein
MYLIKLLRLPLWSILLVGGSVFLIGCPQSSTTSESTDGSTTTTTTTTTETTTTAPVYKILTVTEPDGGETWSQGSTYTITWNKGTHAAKDVGYVGIKLYDGSGDAGTLVHTIEENPDQEEKTPEKANDGSYSWTVPVDIPIGSNYEIRIRAKDADGIVEEDASNNPFTITTTGALSFKTAAFSSGGKIPTTYTCDGSETQLTFTVSDVPSGAKSLVLFIDDLDGTPTSTTTSSDWSHWVVFNIPIVSSINSYTLPSGAVEGTNDANDRAYDRICPPGSQNDRSKHTYRFELYAIDATLDLGPESKRSVIVTAMKGKLLEKSSFTGYFESP